MGKKSKTKRREIRKGVQRHRIGASKSTGEISFLAKALNSVGANRQRVYSSAKICRLYIISVCTRFCLIPFQQPSVVGKFYHASLAKRIIHYALVLFYVTFMMYKFGVIVSLVVFEELSVVTFMCGCSFIVLLLSICAATGSTWSRLEMKQLLNSWEPLRDSIEDSTGRRIDELSSTALCLKLIALTWLVHCAAMNAAAFSLVFEDLPVCVFPIAKRLGLIPENSPLPTILWQIGFYPLELLTLLPPMIVTALNGHTYVIGLGMLKLYADELRLVKCSNKTS